MRSGIIEQANAEDRTMTECENSGAADGVAISKFLESKSSIS